MAVDFNFTSLENMAAKSIILRQNEPKITLFVFFNVAIVF